jgi:CRP-like cAMP-binding protein
MESIRVGAIPVFEGLPEADLAAVAKVASEVEVASGEAVANEGDFGHAMFVIESGTADIVMGNTTVRSVGTGDVLGEIAVLSSGRRTASIVATSPLRLVMLFKRDVWALDDRAPAAAKRLRAALDEHRAMDEQRAADS